MPLYLVRWPGPWMSLVKARDEDELTDILDEDADPTGCRWVPYRGPLFIDFEIPVELADNAGAKVEVADVGDAVSRSPLRASLPSTDTTGEMEQAFLRFGFPALFALHEQSEGDSLDKDEVRRAMEADLSVLQQAAWQRANLRRSKDPLATIALAMGTTTDVVRRMVGEPATERVAATVVRLPTRQPHDRPGARPKAPTAKPRKKRVRAPKRST